MLFKFTLAANADHKIDISGNYVFIEDATGVLQISAGGGTPLVRRAGQGGQRQAVFSTLYVKDLSGAPNTVELEVNLVDEWILENSRQAPVQQGTSPWISKEAAYTTAVPIVSSPGAVAASLTGGSANNREVIIWNEGTTTLYIGPAGVTTANGMPLDAGDKIVLSNCGWQVYGIRVGAAEQVRALVLRD